MDYGAYDDDYGFLVRNYRQIANVLTDKLIALETHMFRARTSYLFGFSFGARLIAKSGIDFGPQKLGRIDCEYMNYIISYRAPT